MITALVLFCGMIAYKRPLIGICILLALECSFVIPDVYLIANFGVIKISVTPVIVLSLFIKTVLNYKNNILSNLDARLLFGLMLWIGFSTGIAYLLGQSTKNDFLTVIFQSVIFYFLPLTVAILPPSERRQLVIFSIILSVVVAVIHLYVLKTMDSSFISNYYYTSEEIDNSAAIIFNNISTGEGEYFIPRGSALIMLTTLFLIGCLIFRTYKNMFELIFVVVTFGICILCSITFAQRAFIFVTIAVSFLLFFISYNKQSITKVVTGILILSFTGYVVISTAVLKTNLINVMVNRISDTNKLKSIDPKNARLAANLDAVNFLEESPVWGIGSIVTGGKGAKSSISQDAHTLLRIGLMGGVPAIFLICVWIANLLIRFIKLSKMYVISNKGLCFPAFSAFLCGMLLMMLNTVPILIYSMNVIPFAIYTGLFISEYNATIYNN